MVLSLRLGARAHPPNGHRSSDFMCPQARLHSERCGPGQGVYPSTCAQLTPILAGSKLKLTCLPR